MKLACVQLNSGNDKEKNLLVSLNLVEIAAKNGAQFISLPEVFNFRGDKEESIKNSETIDGKSIKLVETLAKKLKVWILVGSFYEKAPEKKLPYNSSVLINPEGNVQALYRKIHLFDVKVADKEILESSKTVAGAQACITKIENFKLGMSICYDLRFPELYRTYAKEKVELISVPSAFTKVTGQAHWEVLLRARAIENQAYVIAANQFGKAAGVECYGNSMIIDPWGKVLARASDDREEIIYADLDLKLLEKVREEMPCLTHTQLL